MHSLLASCSIGGFFNTPQNRRPPSLHKSIAGFVKKTKMKNKRQIFSLQITNNVNATNL